MSPTSYQTAPPRDKGNIIRSHHRSVKQYFNYINQLAKFIEFTVSLQCSAIIALLRFPERHLPQIPRALLRISELQSIGATMQATNRSNLSQ